jgi:cytochrome c biogenesis protein CcdA
MGNLTRSPSSPRLAFSSLVSVQLLLLVVSIGLADSLNPATVGPALVLATTRHARLQLAQFAAAVFAVNFAGGAVIALGPGQLLLALLPRPGAPAKHRLELLAGAIMIAAGVLLIVSRERLRRREAPATQRSSRSGLALGAAITAVELPTAFPYFAAIAAIVGSDANVVEQLVLLAVFNVAFLAPVLVILAVLTAAGERAAPLLARLARSLQRNWPVIVGALLLVAGVWAVVVGIVGLSGG